MIDGKALAAKVRQEVAAEVAELGAVGLTTVLVGDDPASHVYIGHKQRAAQEVGIEATDVRLPAETSQEDLLALLDEINADDSVDGILVQLLAEYDIPTTGARAVVIGRSAIVGKPMAHLLLQANATVTIAHSRTQDLQRHTLDADILVAAVGQLHLVGADMVKAGATVIDVGMNRTDEGLFGDVDPGAAEIAGHMTPVPGGVGPMTIAMVLKNTVTAARSRRAREVANPSH
jgi:methylenetetrahydrofolate dehydrogenase (NADP+)/methenyltetrahydrofolate cyclohydrolase